MITKSRLQFVCCLLSVALLSLQLKAAVVLQYHHIGDSFPATTSISAERFQAHMDYLQQHDFKVVSLTSLVEAIRLKQALPDRTVAITFDDAYLSVYDQAAPLLASRNWPYTVFVSTGAVDGGYQGVMSWDQLRDLSQKGADIANHTVSHSHLVRRQSEENAKAWEARILAEIRQAEQRIKLETGQSHRLLAFPYGEYNLNLLRLLQGEDFVGLGQQSGALGQWMDVRLLPRFPFAGNYGGMEDFAIKVNSLPLPVKAMSLADSNFGSWVEPVLDKTTRPELRLKLDFELAQKTRCYASGQGQIMVHLSGEQLIVKTPADLSPGRSRYNCTAPVMTEPGRFYWFSQLFIVRGEGGQWYPES